MHQLVILDYIICVWLEELKTLPNDVGYAKFEPVLKNGINLLMTLYAKEDRALWCRYRSFKAFNAIFFRKTFRAPVYYLFETRLVRHRPCSNCQMLCQRNLQSGLSTWSRGRRVESCGRFASSLSAGEVFEVNRLFLFAFVLCFAVLIASWNQHESLPFTQADVQPFHVCRSWVLLSVWTST